MPDPAPEAWNATERSRAQTRALLTALSRDRLWHLVPEPLSEVVLAVLTLTIATAWRTSGRLRAMEVLTWSQLEEFATWISTFIAADETSPSLAKWAQYWRTTASSRVLAVATVVALLFVIGLSGYGYLLTLPPHPHRPSVSFDRSIAFRILLMMFGAAWTVQLFRLVTHRWHLTGWLKGVNEVLSSQQRRPIEFGKHDVGTQIACLLCFGLLCGQLFTNWPTALVPAVFVLVAASMQLRLERRICLQLIERLLEWMDDTGLPVEYDVTALNPDEIAAMIG